MRLSSPTLTAHTALEIQLRANSDAVLPFSAVRQSDSNAVSFWSCSKEGNLAVAIYNAEPIDSFFRCREQTP